MSIKHPLAMAAVANATALVQPSLVAFYDVDDRDRPTQIGTGLVLDHEGRPLVVTAKHVVFGHSGGDDPQAKHIFAGGLASLRQLEVLDIASCDSRDIAAFYADAMVAKPRLPLSVLTPVTEDKPKVITAYGYLWRDFHRIGPILQPAPFAYTDSRVAGDGDHLTMAYPKHRAVDTHSSEKVMTPTPSGLSGGPMLDTARLVMGKVSVSGVFTDHRHDLGEAFGESAQRVVEFLSSKL